jgi:transcriptional regulator with XRE-family HTH domain
VYNRIEVVKFGVNLRKLREERKISQQQLADMADINLSTVLRIENAKTKANIDILFSISKALEIPVSQLFEHKETE